MQQQANYIQGADEFAPPPSKLDKAMNIARETYARLRNRDKAE